MRRIVLVSSMLITASLLIVSCDPGAGNAGNRPANTANSANNANAAAPANSAAIDADIRKLMADAATALAKNDAAAMDKIYADNYVLVNLDGSVQTRAERLDSLRSGETKYDSFAYDEISVRSNPEGTGAIAIARATIKGINKGKPVDGTIRVTQVYRKTADGWKQVSAQATPITADAAPAKAGDSNMANAGNAANTAKPPPPANK